MFACYVHYFLNLKFKIECTYATIHIVLAASVAIQATLERESKKLTYAFFF